MRARDAVVDWLRSQQHDMAKVPLPGAGATIERWRWLASVARRDLSAARLAEGHLDAIAILTELGRPDVAGRGCWGVWAAEPDRLRATRGDDGRWTLRGEKRWCSGSTALDRALVVAAAPDGPRLFTVEPARLWPVAGSWDPLGMEATASETLLFDLTLDAGAGIRGPHAYVERPGFWHGAMGVAACWFGGTIGVADGLAARSTDARDDLSTLASLGRVRARLDAAADRLTAAAARVDLPPGTVDARRLALSLRLFIEETARAVLDDVNVACGASALAHDRAHADRVADLTLYIRQLHRARDEQSLGESTAEVFTW